MKQRFDLIYNNSFTNGSLLEELNILNKPVITHVHELSYWIERSGEKNLYYIKKFTSKYIAVSEAVKTYLNKCNITDQKIQIIHEFTNVDRMTACQEEKGLRKLLKLPDSCLVIGACGTEFWRKGKDLFIPLAIRTLKHTDKEVHFVWIGGQMDFELQFDLENSGYNKRIHFINHLPDASRYFNDFDIFLMLSREDPFPIVNLEVGALAKPILCFNNSGGTIELLSAINGLVSDYLDIDGMSDKIIGLVNDEKKRFEIGKILQEKIRNHFNINIVASMIEELIKQN
jgi:glycosyltransferase involved in cell wall biosynthesis